MRDFPGDPVIASAGGQVPYLAQELDPTCCNYDQHSQINFFKYSSL